ncbi:MAG: Rab family GTPase [Cuniculiplasma sp.]
MWKVSVVGEPDAGKSSLISRIVFDSEAGSFMGKGLLRKKITIQDQNRMSQAELILQEIDGLPENDKLLAGSSAIIIVVDVTKDVNKKAMEKFIKGANKKALIVIAANKIDRKYEAVTWREDLDPFVKNYNLELFLISTKIPETVNGMIKEIGKLLMGRINGK